jgi:hypothetical protein
MAHIFWKYNKEMKGRTNTRAINRHFIGVTRNGEIGETPYLIRLFMAHCCGNQYASIREGLIFCPSEIVAERVEYARNPFQGRSRNASGTQGWRQKGPPTLGSVPLPLWGSLLLACIHVNACKKQGRLLHSKTCKRHYGRNRGMMLFFRKAITYCSGSA